VSDGEHLATSLLLSCTETARLATGEHLLKIRQAAERRSRQRLMSLKQELSALFTQSGTRVYYLY
jgi:hypothetical protein